jgi:hypothetical protein
MREIELIKKYNYDQKKAHDLLKEEFVKDLLEEVKDLIKENKVLTRQLEYIRSGEYLNQLKFERNMLEDVVSNGEVSETDKAFIDMTHRNTELLEENKKLKERIDYLERSNNRREELILELREELIPSKGDNEDV